MRIARGSSRTTAGRWRAGRAAGLCSHPDCAAAWLAPVPRRRRASPARRSSLGHRSRPGPCRAECPRSGRACSSCRAAGRSAALAAGQRLPGAAPSAVALTPPMMIWAGRSRLAAGDGGRAGVRGAGHPWAPRCRCRDAGTCPPGVSTASRPGMRRRSLQRHLPLVQIGSFGRMLQRVHRAGCLVGTEHRTAPAARADRLNGALAQLPDRGGVMPGHRCPTGMRPGGAGGPHHAAAGPTAGRPPPGPPGGIPRPRPRDDIAGPGRARRGHGGSGAGSGPDQDVQGDHVTPPGLLPLFNPHSPGESSLPPVRAGVDLARFRAR